MKYILFFLTLSFLVASCGSYNNGKLRFVKTDNAQREIIETRAKSSEKEHKTSSESAPKHIETSFQESEEFRVSDEVVSTGNAREQQLENETSSDDSLTNEDPELINQANQAEKNAKAAAIQSGIGFVTPFVPLLGIIMTILGFVFYKRASKSRYITLEGERYLRLSRTFLIIDIAIIGLAILLFSIFLLLFL